MENILILENEELLDNIQNHEEGEIVYCENTQTYYKWIENNWNKIEFKNDASGISMNLYELNKNIVKQLPEIKLEHKHIEMLNNYHNKMGNYHYMLMCKEWSYYTIFESDPTTSIPTFAAAVCDIISDLGSLRSIEETNDGAIEIWTQPTDVEECYVFYLFPYDKGVVYFG